MRTKHAGSNSFQAWAILYVSRVLITAIVTPIIFAAHDAFAQSAASSLEPQRPPAYCKGSTLNTAEFLRIIHEIIAHGDLGDVAFMEKTLGTKFSVTYGSYGDGSPPQPSYQSDQMLGTPIHTSLDILNFKRPVKWALSTINFGDPDSRDSFLADCMRLTIGDFKDFKGESFELGYSSPPVGAGAVIHHVASGKNDAKFDIRIDIEVPPETRVRKYDLVRLVWVDQVP